MKINRRKVQELFQTYTSQYDKSDAKIRLKINHTYRVASLCDQIGKSLKMTEEQLDLAWLCGMLHDIGRFEQVRRYGTFIDKDSIDHAKLSTMLLFGEQWGESLESTDGILSREFGELGVKNHITIDDFLDLKQKDGLDSDEGKQTDTVANAWEKEVIRQAVLAHSAYRIPKETDEQVAVYCHLLRDADKIDILKVNIETPKEEIYNVTSSELKNEQVSPAVMQAFYEHHAVSREARESAIDNLVGHICLTYELVYPFSFVLMKNQGYLEKLMDFESDNPVTKEQFAAIREEMHHFLELKSQEEE